MLYRRWTMKSNPAVLLLPPHPQISTLPLGCALGAGGQKINPEHRGSCLEICATLKFGTGEILLGRHLWGLIFLSIYSRTNLLSLHKSQNHLVPKPMLDEKHSDDTLGSVFTVPSKEVWKSNQKSQRKERQKKD